MAKRKLLDGKHEAGRLRSLRLSGKRGEDFAVTWNSGRDLFPAKLCRHVPRNSPPPPLVSREKRIDGSGFRCGMVIYLGGFFLFFSNWMFFTFSTTIPSNLKIEFLRHRLRAKGINKGEKLTPRLALAEKLFQLGSEEGEKGEEEEEGKHGYSARFE